MSALVISDYAAFDSLKNDWDQLALPRNNPLLEFNWFHACAHELHPEKDLNVITLTDSSGKICGIAPLVKTRRHGSHWLEILGASTLFEPTGLLYRDSNAMSSLYRMLARQQYPVLINRLWESREENSIIRQTPCLSGLWIKRHSHGSGILDIQSDWISYLASLSSQRRYDYRRAVKRTASFGDEHYSVVSPNLNVLDQTLDIAFGIEDNSWKGKQGTSIRSRPRLRSFLQRYARYSAESGQLRIFLLHLGDRPAAMAICIESGSALWFIKIGYDDNFRTCSPGMLLMMHAVKYGFDQGLSRIEFLGSYEPWLSIWTRNIRTYSTLVHYPPNIHGIRTFSHDLIKTIRSRIYHIRQTTTE